MEGGEEGGGTVRGGWRGRVDGRGMWRRGENLLMYSNYGS